MWVVNPFQDWMSLNSETRYPDPAKARINVPSNPNNYWNYRLHINIEDLINDDNLNNQIKTMINQSQR